jgi:hypothetical protein
MSFWETSRPTWCSPSLVREPDLNKIEFFDLNEYKRNLYNLENPKQSIIEMLEKLKKAKQTNVIPPSLLEEPNLESMFGILDPSGKGSINYKQYCEG